MTETAVLGRLGLAALGTSGLLLVTDPDHLSAAAEVLHRELTAIDEACSRFRPDSEINWLHRNAGKAVTVSPMLAEAIEVALRAAALTDGLVDPTVGAAVADLGYDRDFAEVLAGSAEAASVATDPVPKPAPGWWRLSWDPFRRELVLPRGISLDLGATAKALAADRAATRAAEITGGGVLVDLGGDVAAAGPTPEGGWRIALADDHRAALAEPEQVVAVGAGGLATSGTTVRAWRKAGTLRHHIVDPRTGENPPSVWRTVTVVAGSCVDANTASTAAIVLGTHAIPWLAARGLPARLVASDGRVSHTEGWPTNEEGV